MKVNDVQCMNLLALVILVGTCGCTTTKTAKLLTWRPAQFNVAGVERLAVLGFRAPSNISSVVQETALNDLQQSRFYSIVRDTRPARLEADHIPMPTEAGGLDEIVARGRQLGVDAVLVGRVRKRFDLGKEIGNLTVQVGDPKLYVTVQYYIVDVRTRTIRAQQRITRMEREEGLGQDDAMTKRIVDKLVRKCSAEMVQQITAGSDLVEVELARVNLGKGSGYIRDGNRLAAKGNWKQAAEKYLSALEVNPGSHEAIYNIGLAAEAQGRFDEAKSMFARAIRQSDEPLYRLAEARVDKTSQSFHLAQQQTRQRPRSLFEPGDRYGNRRVGPPARHFGNVNSHPQEFPNHVAGRNDPRPDVPRRDSQVAF